MKAKQVLDQVELTCKQRGIKPDDRLILLKHLNWDLAELLSREDWDWAQVYVNPIATTKVGVREYDLESNFPENFVKGRGDHGEDYEVQYSDGDTDYPLHYLSPARFYGQNLTAEDNASPSHYTIMVKPDGRKQIVLSPPPDAAYDIHGLYIPVWTCTDETDLPPIPACSTYLKYSILCRYDVNTYAPFLARELSTLYMRAAKQHATQLVPTHLDPY